MSGPPLWLSLALLLSLWEAGAGEGEASEGGKSHCSPVATAKNRRFASASLLERRRLPLPECIRLCCETFGCSGLTYTGFITSPTPFCELLHCPPGLCDTLPGEASTGLISVLLNPNAPSPTGHTPSSSSPSLAPVSVLASSEATELNADAETREATRAASIPSSPLVETGSGGGNESDVELRFGGSMVREACVPYSVVGIMALLVLVCGVLNCALLAGAALGRRERGRQKPQPPPSAPVFSTHLRAYDNLHLDVDSHPPLPSSALPSPASNGAFRNISTLS